MHPLSQFKYCPKCGSNHFVENNIKSKKCEDCGFIYYFNSCASTVALIVKDDKLLVATRAHEPAKGTLDLPGGFVDMYETGEEAVMREIKEETCLDVVSVEYLYSITNTYVYSGFEVHTLDMVFRCIVDDIRGLKAEDDVAKLEFIKISELDPNKFGLNSVREIVKRLQNIKI